MPVSEQDQNQETFSNDNVTICVSKKPCCEVSLDVKVSSNATESCYQKAVKNVRKEVNIPGFRKGKVPESMIFDKYAKAIQDEFLDVVLETAFNESISLTHLEPIKQSIKRPIIHKCNKEEGAHFTFQYETKVMTPSIDLNSISLRLVKPSEITQEHLKAAKDDFCMQFVTYSPVEDRPVKENDFVDIDVHLQTEPPRSIASNQRVRVDSSNMPSWLCQKIIGMKAGETREGFSEKTDSDSSEDFEPIPYKATVHAIFTADIPAFDDELAKRAQAPSSDAVLEKIEKQLQRQETELAEKQNFDILNRYLIEHYPFDIPTSLINEEVAARVEFFKKEYPQHSQEELNEYRNFIQKMAPNNLRVFFLIRKCIAENNIDVNEQDIQDEFYTQVYKKTNTGTCDVDFQDRNELEKQIRNLALNKKVRRFLIEKATHET